MKALKEKILAITTSLILLALAFSTNTKLVRASPVQFEPKVEVTFNRPRGVNCPDRTFEVEITPYSKVGGIEDEKMPTTSNMLLRFPGDYDEQGEYAEEYNDGHRLIADKKIPLSPYDFPYGYNTYRFTQVSGNDEFTTYSKATYLVTYDTPHALAGQSTAIYVKKITDDDGNPVDEGKKIYDWNLDKTPIVFNNYYDKKDGNENPTPGSQITPEDKRGFSLRKTITGENPSKTDEFKFKFKLDKPKISKSPDTEFNYYIVKEDAIEKLITSYNTDTEINLRHNERLVLGKVLLGSKLTVNETNAGLYNGSIKQSKFFESNDQANTGIIGEQEGGNFVEYENQKITPTGLLIDNLPFVLVVLVAGVGIIFFVRNSRKEEYLG